MRFRGLEGARSRGTLAPAAGASRKTGAVTVKRKPTRACALSPWPTEPSPDASKWRRSHPMCPSTRARRLPTAQIRSGEELLRGDAQNSRQESTCGLHPMLPFDDAGYDVADSALSHGKPRSLAVAFQPPIVADPPIFWLRQL